MATARPARVVITEVSSGIGRAMALRLASHGARVAGIRLDRDPQVTDLLAVNLLGYARGARAAARYMVPAGTGAVVNVGSVVEVPPPTEMSAYVTADPHRRQGRPPWHRP
jgi:NAD(P)-dependent dehydrogenase (short-subunit alcohol dehydrogenase family)